MVFGTIHLINFAHGEFVTIGATFAFFLNVSPAGPGWHLIPAALAAVVFGALLGGAVDRGIWRPLRARGTGLINMFIVTIGLAGAAPRRTRAVRNPVRLLRPVRHPEHDRPRARRHHPAGPHGHPPRRAGAARHRRAPAEDADRHGRPGRLRQP
ncbi:hypothetical protein ACWD0J_07675 [Streptomyces sp. NPDC003011]